MHMLCFWRRKETQLKPNGSNTKGISSDYMCILFFYWLAKNVQNRHPTIPADPNNPGVQIPGPLFLGSKSLKRLKIASDEVRYYETIDIEITPANMHFTNVLKKFELQWQSLQNHKEEAGWGDVPKISSKILGITRWTEAFKD